MFSDLSAFNKTLFDSVFDDHFGSPMDYLDHLHHLQKMQVDRKDCGDHYEMTIPLEGYQKDQIHVELDGAFLLISAAKPSEEAEGTVHCLRRFYVGGVTPGDISSKFEQNILYISLPKRDTDERPATVEIPIQ